MKKYILALVLLSIYSCAEKIEKPEKFLEKPEMTNLLYDLALLTSAKSFQYNDTLVKTYTAQQILNNYGLDSLSFAQLNNYYTKQPDLYIEMFDTINKRFQKRIQETELLPEDPRDTIQDTKILNMKNFKSVLK